MQKKTHKKKWLRKLIRTILIAILIPISYFLISLLLTYLPTGSYSCSPEKEIFIHTNGVHLDLIIPINQLDTLIAQDFTSDPSHQFLSFGWGDENFYLNTPNWSDLTLSNAFQAMFLKSSTLMHVTRHSQEKVSWRKILLSEKQFQEIFNFIQETFQVNSNKQIIILPNQGYSTNDDFYKAKGSYSCLYTCNSWINSALKEAGLRASVWTPFDFGVIGRY